MFAKSTTECFNDKDKIKISNLPLIGNISGEDKQNSAIVELGKCLLEDDYKNNEGTWNYCIGLSNTYRPSDSIPWTKNIGLVVLFFLILLNNKYERIEDAIKNDSKGSLEFNNGDKICKMFRFNGQKGRYRNLKSDWFKKLSSVPARERQKLSEQINETIMRVRDGKMNKNEQK